MGNCATCCGKQDTHEIDTTEKIKGVKLGKSEAGVAYVNDFGRKGFGNLIFKTNSLGEEAYYEGQADPFLSGDLEINNEAYNNPAVMVKKTD